MDESFYYTLTQDDKHELNSDTSHYNNDVQRQQSNKTFNSENNIYEENSKIVEQVATLKDDETILGSEEFNTILHRNKTNNESGINEIENIINNVDEVGTQDLKQQYHFNEAFIDFTLNNNNIPFIKRKSNLYLNIEPDNSSNTSSMINKLNCISGKSGEECFLKHEVTIDSIDEIEDANSSRRVNLKDSLFDTFNEENVDIENFIKLNVIETSTNPDIPITSSNIILNTKADEFDEISLISISSDSDYLNVQDNAKKEDILDIISVSSDNEEMDLTNGIQLDQDNVSDDCDGYHSSDFEFIDETDAAKGDFIINTNPSPFKSQVKVETLEISKEFSQNSIIYDYFNMPGPSYKNRDNHVIPMGEDYNKLFLENFLSHPMDIVENKTIRPLTSMHAQYEGIGFDMRFINRFSDEDKSLNDEAKKTARLIRSMHPNENVGRRTRYQGADLRLPTSDS